MRYDRYGCLGGTFVCLGLFGVRLLGMQGMSWMRLAIGTLLACDPRRVVVGAYLAFHCWHLRSLLELGGGGE